MKITITFEFDNTFDAGMAAALVDFLQDGQSVDGAEIDIDALAIAMDGILDNLSCRCDLLADSFDADVLKMLVDGLKAAARNIEAIEQPPTKE